MKNRKVWVLVVCSILVAPAYVMGESDDKSSLDFVGMPNLPMGSSGELKMRAGFNQQGCGPIEKSFNLGVFPSAPGPRDGKDVAREAYDEFCEEVLAKGWTVDSSSSNGTGFCAESPSDPNTCCIGDLTKKSLLQAKKNCGSGGGLKGLRMIREANADRFTVEGVDYQSPPTMKLTSLHGISKAGNSVGEDPLAQLLVSVDRGSPVVDANINFTVRRANDPNTYAFTVNSTGQTDSALHAAIATGFNGLPISPALECKAATRRAGEVDMLSRAQADYKQDIVFCQASNRTGLTDVSAKGVQNQTIIVETNSTQIIPTLSEWGLILLAATLLLTGAWMLHRRRSAVSA